MRAEAPIQVHSPREERINGKWYYNTGKFGTIERVSYFRVCVAGGIAGAVAFAIVSEFPPLVKVIVTIGGIYAGMKMGEECTVKEKGMIKYKILSMDEYREAIEEENLQYHLEKHGFKSYNIFKLIWP